MVLAAKNLCPFYRGVLSRECLLGEGPLCRSSLEVCICAISNYQVAEVLSQDKIRLSVNGWFHGPPVERPQRYIEPARPRRPYVQLEVGISLL